MSDAAKWRTVSVHGQPKIEDFPILLRWADGYGPELRLSPRSGLAFNTQWAPITLPDGDEPPPLPKPFKPMDSCPATTRRGGSPYLYATAEVCLFSPIGNAVSFVVTDGWVPGSSQGWCTPDEWHAFLFGGAS